MAVKTTSPGYALGNFSIADEPLFPGLVIGDRVIALCSLKPLCAELEVELSGIDSMLNVLINWPENSPCINKVAKHLIQHPEAWSLIQTEPVYLADLNVHAPVNEPRQFFCSGANYRTHVVDLIVDMRHHPDSKIRTTEELKQYANDLMDHRINHGEPYIFTKAVSSICGPFDEIHLQNGLDKIDWELELAVVIGKETFQVSQEAAMDSIAGYTIVNDITNRDLVHRDDLKAIGTDWVMGKSLPTYSPMGPYMVPASEIENPQELLISLKLNGQTMQHETTADMIFSIPKLISYLSSRVKLLPGDILITGSPAGNGTHFNRFLQAGDVMEGSIEGIGSIINPCIKQPEIN